MPALPMRAGTAGTAASQSAESLHLFKNPSNNRNSTLGRGGRLSMSADDLIDTFELVPGQPSYVRPMEVTGVGVARKPLFDTCIAYNPM